jgi:uncharacterized membrane protein YjjP (DUF1212 family)
MAVMSTNRLSGAAFEQRVRFICLLSSRLHQYGTAAQRLETAVDNVAQRLGLQAVIWSNPTGILLSFADSADGDDALPRVTQIVRLDPGDNDLRRLSIVDRIAEGVASGAIDLAEGYRQLRRLAPDRRRLRGEVLYALAHGVAAGTVAVLLKTGWSEVAAAAAIGTLVGLLGLAFRLRSQLKPGYEAVAGVLAALLAAFINAKVAPIATGPVVLASVIVLLPGLALTTAVNELANQHLVSGTARFAGALSSLLKLGFGTAAGVQIARLSGYDVPPAAIVPVPVWAEWVGLAIGSFNFAVLFRCGGRDYPLAMAAVWLGYLTTRFASGQLGSEFGVFFAALVVGTAANVYARWRNRPGALVRVPGIILLVPGSVGFRSFSFVFARDVYLGLDTAFTLVALLISLVAGLLFANVLITPRRTLS